MKIKPEFEVESEPELSDWEMVAEMEPFDGMDHNLGFLGEIDTDESVYCPFWGRNNLLLLKPLSEAINLEKGFSELRFD